MKTPLILVPITMALVLVGPVVDGKRSFISGGNDQLRKPALVRVHPCPCPQSIYQSFCFTGNEPCIGIPDGYYQIADNDDGLQATFEHFLPRIGELIGKHMGTGYIKISPYTDYLYAFAKNVSTPTPTTPGSSTTGEC